MRALILVVALLAGGAALARKPQEFNPPREMTQEELDAAKERSKSRLRGYGKDMPVEMEPIPWRAISLAGLTFLIAAPFALRFFRDTSKNLTNHTAGRNASSRED